MFFFYIKSFNHDISKDYYSTEPIGDFIDDCIKRASSEGLSKIGVQAGYIEIPYVKQFEDTAFWYLDQINIQPSLNETLIRLQDYIDDNLGLCIDDFIVFKKEGFKIEYNNPTTKIFFSKKDVIVDVDYKVEIMKEEKYTKYDTFLVNLDVRFRNIYELASQIMNKQLETDFDFYNPLKDVDLSDFDVEYSYPEEDVIIYTITDKTRYEQWKYYSFKFANRFKKSELPKRVKLHNNSNIVPVSFSYEIYSPDRMSVLSIGESTIMSLKGDAVDKITVSQTYPETVTRTQVPMDVDGEDVVRYDDIDWVMDYPVYNYEPDGMDFNYPQKITIYWDDARNPNEGNMGLLYNDGVNGWSPIRTVVDYEENKIESIMFGFSSITPVDGDNQGTKDVSAKSTLEPRSDVACIALAVLSVPKGFSMIFGMMFGDGLFFQGYGFGDFNLWNYLSLNAGWIAGTYIFNEIGLYEGVYWQFPSDSKDCIEFVPTVNQEIIVKEDSSDTDDNIFGDLWGGEGKCHVIYDDVAANKTFQAEGGSSVNICAETKKCKILDILTCQKCSTKCSTSYK